MLGDETARADSRGGRAARRALGERRARLQMQNRMENGVGRNALSKVVEAAARQQQKDQDRSGPSHLVE
jgi:hypothetical protein